MGYAIDIKGMAMISTHNCNIPVLTLCILFLQSLVKGPREQGVLSSIVSWIATGNNLPSLIETQACGEFSWFALQVLNAEAEYEEECGLWTSIQKELFANPTVSVDQALKVSLCLH